MASPSRRTTRDLADEIRGDAPRFSFFQAIRLLALAEGKGGESASLPANLRFGTPLSLGFPASEISGVRPHPARADGDGAAPAEGTPEWLMTVAFMGLTGPAGALPIPYTELLIERQNQFRDSAGHAFLDMFSHRSIALLYQAWRKHRFYLSYEAKQGDGFSRNVLDLAGMGLGKLQRRLDGQGNGIPDRFLIHYAGLLARRPVSATNIAALVQGFFGVEAELEQFVGQWISLVDNPQSLPGAGFGQLGRDSFLGERLWDRQNKIRVRLGPLSHEQYEEFLPGRPAAEALKELVHFCVGHALACDFTLVLRRDAIPSASLGADPASGPRLGQSLWLNSRPAQRDADSASFALLA
jgi:type VI secretion system protein ImpH